MPAGVGWGPYLRYTAAAMLSMFAGAQAVHILYRPMDDFDRYIAEALKKDEDERIRNSKASGTSSRLNTSTQTS